MGRSWYTETGTFYDGAPGIGLECARWFSSLRPPHRRRRTISPSKSFRRSTSRFSDPCHQHLIMENGIHLHEGMTFEGLCRTRAWAFAYVFAPLPIVGATGSPGNPIACAWSCQR